MTRNLKPNDEGFIPAGNRRRRYKPTVVKGTANVGNDILPTVEKKITYCVSGLASTATEEQVRSFISSFASVEDVSLLENRAQIYDRLKMFKVTVGVSQIEAMKNQDNWPVNLIIRRFRINRSTTASATATGANIESTQTSQL